MKEAANEMTRAFERTAKAFAGFNRAYRRSEEIDKWRKRSKRAPRRWRRWVARYVHWCLMREAQRDIRIRELKR